MRCLEGHRWFGAVLTLLVICTSVTLRAGHKTPSYKVIVHPTCPVEFVDKRELLRIFLKKNTRWPESALVYPVDLHADSDIRKRFTDDVMERSVSAVLSHWQQAIFSGRAVPPLELKSDAEIVRYVINTKGAIGYVSIDAPVGSAKVIEVR
ncbi:MAG: hypothetical protein R3C68_15015 [Myxococcota bacterium]